jgi:RHS Repeat
VKLSLLTGMREDVRVLDFRDFGSRAIAEVTEIPEESRATMFDRDRLELRGPVKSCTEETTHPSVTDDEGKTYPAVHVAVTTEYDSDGRKLATRNHHPGGQSVSYFEYDASGRLLKVASGVEGQALLRPGTPTIGEAGSRTFAMLLDPRVPFPLATTSGE